jgi:hypothetical protein
MSACYAALPSCSVHPLSPAIGVLGIALAVMVCGLSPAAEESPTSKQVEQDLKILTDEYNRAILARDKATLQRLLAEDFKFGREILVSKNNHIRDIVNATNAPDKQTVDTWGAQIYGDTAIVTGIATATRKSTTPKDSYVVKFRWVNVWVKRNGAWQVVYNQSTPFSVANDDTAEPRDQRDGNDQGRSPQKESTANERK